MIAIVINVPAQPPSCSSSQLSVGLKSDAASYQAGSPVTFSVVVRNTGASCQPAPCPPNVQVSDATGRLVWTSIMPGAATCIAPRTVPAGWVERSSWRWDQRPNQTPGCRGTDQCGRVAAGRYSAVASYSGANSPTISFRIVAAGQHRTSRPSGAKPTVGKLPRTGLPTANVIALALLSVVTGCWLMMFGRRPAAPRAGRAVATGRARIERARRESDQRRWR
jgi:hypothetical protein